ncbi:PHD finger protein 21A-like isoform X2 [Tachypleus tridentatus]|uniref:PHD finger protein 21A-like isoform X2 n=1 Tax=Tachypleus tridentatus TaxID=6853 RepID=UPI003FD2461F
MFFECVPTERFGSALSIFQNMDLQTLQKHLKSAIQNHQIVVSKMRNDPQNAVLQKHLHDLQSEIQNLSEKQKLVVEQLRKEVEKKKQSQNQILNPNQFNDVSCQQNTPVHTTSQPQVQVRLVPSTTPSQFMQKVTLPIQVQSKIHLPTSKQGTLIHSLPQQALRHVVPTVVNSLVSTGTNLTLKTPLGTAVLLPSCSTSTSALLSTRPAEQHRSQPLLVVPSISTHSGDGPRFVLNLSPPIRIPQYPPPLNKVTVPVVVSNQTLPLSNNVLLGQTASVIVSTSQSLITVKPSVSVSRVKMVAPVLKQTQAEEQKKADFMSALGLVTKDTLSELQNKKVERKRRTTANPQFSNAALEEKRRNAAFLNVEGKYPSYKKSRGRPRLISSPSKNGSFCVQDERTVASAELVPNGFHSPCKTAIADTHEDMCAICRQQGELLMCDTCNLVFHLTCLKPPLLTVPVGSWSCPQCQPSQSDMNVEKSSVSTSQPTATITCVVSVTPPTLSVPVMSTCALTVPIPSASPCVVSLPIILTSANPSNIALPAATKAIPTVPVPVSVSLVATNVSVPTTVLNHRNTPITTTTSVINKAAKKEEKQNLVKRSMELRSEKIQLEEKAQDLISVISNQKQKQIELQSLYQKTSDSLNKLQDVIRQVKESF